MKSDWFASHHVNQTPIIKLGVDTHHPFWIIHCGNKDRVVPWGFIITRWYSVVYVVRNLPPSAGLIFTQTLTITRMTAAYLTTPGIFFKTYWNPWPHIKSGLYGVSSPRRLGGHVRQFKCQWRSSVGSKLILWKHFLLFRFKNNVAHTLDLKNVTTYYEWL